MTYRWPRKLDLSGSFKSIWYQVVVFFLGQEYELLDTDGHIVCCQPFLKKMEGYFVKNEINILKTMI